MNGKRLSLGMTQALNGAAARVSRLFRAREADEGCPPGLPQVLPRHVAIAMDGNGRWAQRRALPRMAGHSAGVDALREVIRACDDWGIGVLTVFAFSTENWGRPNDEVGALMSMMLQLLRSEVEELHRKNVKVRIIGDIAALPAPQREAVERSMERTQGNTGLRFNIAINYGARDELLHAARALAQRACSEGVDPQSFTMDDLEAQLYTSGLPDVDLFIRTSGEMRLSNFLLWQSAYAELVFNGVLWPDYTKETFRRDLWKFAARSRRFGKV